LRDDGGQVWWGAGPHIAQLHLCVWRRGQAGHEAE
jgi:hypothetical protein